MLPFATYARLRRGAYAILAVVAAAKIRRYEYMSAMACCY